MEDKLWGSQKMEKRMGETLHAGLVGVWRETGVLGLAPGCKDMVARAL